MTAAPAIVNAAPAAPAIVNACSTAVAHAGTAAAAGAAAAAAERGLGWGVAVLWSGRYSSRSDSGKPHEVGSGHLPTSR